VCTRELEASRREKKVTRREEVVTQREVGVKTGGYGRILAHPVSYPNVFKTDSGSDTDS
jgi:hypothetical protein